MPPLLWKEYLGEWAKAIVHTPQLLHRIAFRPRTIEEELVEASLQGTLRRILSSYNLLSLGMGFVIASGVFVLTGEAFLLAGPAMIVSYLLSGVAAILGATCYSEFAVEYPVAGAGFTYIMVTFGELPAWITVCNLLLEYMLGTAAIARGFSLYVARLFRQPEDWLLMYGTTDFLAFGVIIFLTIIVSMGVRESSLIISTLVAVHVVLLTSMMIAMFTQAEPSNMTNPTFLLGGLDNMLAAGAVLFFAYAGFDVVAMATEEARRPEHVPRAMLGTTAIATLVYFLLSLSLAMMVGIQIDSTGKAHVVYNGVLVDQCSPGSSGCTEISSFVKAAFSEAFWAAGMKGMYYVTCVAALNGTFTALLVGLYGVSRIVMVAARDWLIPPFLATIYPRTQTPVIAQVVFGLITALVALFARFTTLSDMVSIGTVLVMCTVANALLFRRYYPGLPRLRYSRWGTVESAEAKPPMPFKVPGAKLSLRVRQWLVVGHMVLINGLSVGLATLFQVRTQVLTLQGVDYNLSDPGVSRWIGTSILFLSWILATASMQLLCPLEYQPPKWSIPWWLMPWLPSTTILLMIFTIASIPQRHVYYIFGLWLAGSLVVYFLFSMPMSYIKHDKLDYVNTEEMNVVELSFKGGKWQPKRPVVAPAYAGASSVFQTSYASNPTTRYTRNSVPGSPGQQPWGSSWPSTAAGGENGPGSGSLSEPSSGARQSTAGGGLELQPRSRLAPIAEPPVNGGDAAQQHR